MLPFCSNKEIAAEIGYSDQTIRNVRSRFRGDLSLYQKPEKVMHWPCVTLTKANWPKCGHGDRCHNGHRCGAAIKYGTKQAHC